MNERIRQFFKDILQVKEVLVFLFGLIVVILNIWLATKLSPIRQSIEVIAAINNVQDQQLAILKEDIAEIKDNSRDTNDKVLDIYKLFFKN